MSVSRRSFLRRSIAGSAALYAPFAASPAAHSFAVSGDQFLLDGKQFQIFSGSMHYPRVPRSYWRDRMRKLKALGLNTLCTYVFWNAHEKQPGQFDFTGNLDVRAYLQTAQEEGLWVILRPGPYVCAEWDFGGFPWWLLKNRNSKVRTEDPNFLQAASRYLHRVGQELAPLQITQGGPIILCQVENEYGSFGKNHSYMQTIRKLIIESGFDVPLYTADGPEQLPNGALPGCVAVINFGATKDPSRDFARLEQFRPNGPRMCGEYWDGWFDHWGETHHGAPTNVVIQGLEWMVSRGISFNLYMAHGGTSFGFTPGANWSKSYQPDITSYDYDAPIDEAGRPTPKFFAIRDLLDRHAEPLPNIPDPQPSIAIPRFQFSRTCSLFASLPDAQHADRPNTMDELNQPHGLVLYRTKLSNASQGTLEVRGANDYAILYANGKRLGTLDRRFQETQLPIKLDANTTLDILVDAMGYVNFGPRLGEDRKGITGGVFLNGNEITGWQQYSLPLSDISKLAFDTTPADGPAFYHAQANLDQTGDTFLDMRGWGKGYVWVNGQNLGRYWSVGPQRSVFWPGAWQQKGANQIVVLDLEQGGDRSLESRTDPIYDTTEQAFLASESVKPPTPYGATPTPRQIAWSGLEFYNFLHFTINTFTDKEWGYGDESPALFNPTDFDADAIVGVLKDAGSKAVILTCKHHDGFCLWPTKTTKRSIQYSPYKNGKGDIVREIADAAQRHGLKFGVYVSPWDRSQSTYGTPQYISLYREQIRELLTGYGPIFEIWHDGANGGDGYYGGAREKRIIDKLHYYQWPETWAMERELQPGAAIFSDVGPDVRWVGNEKGIAGETCWATYTPLSPNGGPGAPGDVDAKQSTVGTPDGKYWMPAECDVSIRPGWFWHAKENSQVKSPDDLMTLYYESVGRGASFLLNVPPDRRGLIYETDAQSLRSFGKRLQATFGNNLAKEARLTASHVRGKSPEYGVQNLVNDDPNTYWATGDNLTNAEITLEFPREVQFNIVRLREYTPLGQRVRQFAVEAWKDGAWSPVANGTSIGICRLLRSPSAITTNRVRLRITESAACPALSAVALFNEA